MVTLGLKKRRRKTQQSKMKLSLSAFENKGALIQILTVKAEISICVRAFTVCLEDF